MNSVYGWTEPQNDVNRWLDGVTSGKVREKVTNLKFYVQDILGGPNATVSIVAQGPESSKSATGFGVVSVIDDLFTDTPEPTSTPLGRVQGVMSFASKDELAFLMAINFVITAGKFNGSNLTVLGRNPVVHPLREMPIVGGTGVFRLARGFITTRNYRATTLSKSGVYEYNIFAIHY